MPPRHIVLPAALAVVAAGAVGAGRAHAAEAKAASGAAGRTVDFKKDVLPILQRACVECHGPKKTSGGLKLHNGAGILEGGISGKAIEPGKPAASYLIERLLGEGGEDRMPLKANPLDDDEFAVIKGWIEQGAVVPPEDPKLFIPAPGGMKRLTVTQYRNTIRDMFGEAVKVPTDLEADTLISGSAAVGAARIGLSRRATEQFANAAADLAAQALGSEAFRSAWVPCDVEAPSIDAACVEGFVRRFGRRAWRRSLGADEIARYAALARGPDGAAGARGRSRARAGAAGARRALEIIVAALLQSPNFIYRVEVGVPDPEVKGRRILTDFELASRLSYFLWGAPPDEALLDAAEAGRLSTEEGLRAEADRMLASPRSRQTMTAFFTELLRLRRLERLPQFRSAFRQAASRTLGASMRAETLKVIEEVAFDPQRDFREIFDTKFTYVNDELAKLYGLPAPEKKGELVRVTLPNDQPRAGILGHASFLALNAHPTASSPTKRGKFIREVLLCQAVPPPPPNVSAKLPEDHEGSGPRTTREKLDVHRKAPQCAGCHKAMDPMGLAFETFDGIGAFRKTENGLPIDATGELDGVPFKDASELGALLRKNSRVGVCVARSLFRFALGHLEEEGDEPLVDELARGLERDGFKFYALVLNVVKSRGFRYVSDPD
jgi:mono/diheme cytochrome c family protein/PAS domain-containing protein